MLLDQDKLGQFNHSLSSYAAMNANLMEKNEGVWGEELETLYIGGGTPSLWGREGAETLGQLLKDYCPPLSSKSEFTLEVNPGSWTEETLASWESIGCNRYSLGVQSVSADYLKLLDRVHNITDVHKTLAHFSDTDRNFSVDFMIGLPDSEKKKRDIVGELESIMQYRPKHISLYILTVKDNYVHSSRLPSDEWIEHEYLSTSEYLRNRGFDHYEVSNFAQPGFESKHNLRYWEAASVAAWGPSATGFLTREQVALRYKWNNKSQEFKVENLSTEEIALERLYLAIRTNRGTDLSDHFSGEDLPKIKKLAQKWVEKGQASLEGSHLVLTPGGYLVMDSLMGEIFNVGL